MAKQHQVRGEDASALRMFQMALPYFPANDKLKTKMRNLEERIRAKREADVSQHASAPIPVVSTRPTTTCSQPQPSSLMAPLRAEKKQSKSMIIREDSDEDDFVPVAAPDAQDSYMSDAGFQYKAKAARKPKKATKKLPIFRDSAEAPDMSAAGLQPGEQTPRTTQLLRIINSRDVAQIKALKGVGTKKADAIVSCLVEMDDDEVQDLESLALLKGVGGRTVANMRMGLSIDMDF